MIFNKKTAVILFNLGGPDKPESVKPFLFNLFNDKAIISLPQPFRFLLAKLISSKREKTAQEIYANLGGKSPLLDLTIGQSDALEKELSFIGNFKVFTCMRYWKPFSTDIISKVASYEPDQIIALPLYPQFSSATSDSSIQDFLKVLKKHKSSFKDNLKTKVVCCYPIEKDFILSHSNLIKKSLSKHYCGNISDFRFLFSAHGLPQKVIDKGDPYVFQVQQTMTAVTKHLAQSLNIAEDELDAQICFQSKVGPLKWTSPSLDQELKRVALDNKIPVIIPIAFVSEHSETLVELDIEYKEKADELGIKEYVRVPALNSDGHFIKALVDICKAVDKNKEHEVFAGGCADRICPKKMKLCINPNDNL